MLSSRLSRLKHLEDAGLEEERQTVILRVQYAATATEPALWGPTYVYRLPSGGCVEAEGTPDET